MTPAVSGKVHNPATDRVAAILVVNAGSSTVKTALFTDAADPVALDRAAVAGTTASDPHRVAEQLYALSGGRPVSAIGHRMVHGGPRHLAPIRLTPAVLEDLRDAIPFAPNHLPAAIAIIERLARVFPSVPQVACFDTTFHRDLPDVARRLAIPSRYDAAGIRRYGFHGLSCEHVLETLRRGDDPERARGRLVVAHLGNGSSITAVHHGRSVDTSMGLTPLGGLVMSTRSGDLDPGVVAFIAKADDLTGDQIEALFSQESGLKAISGHTGDMKVLLDSQDAASRLAVDIYVYQAKKWIGAFAAAMGGLDGLIFTGGIGEHATAVRDRICAGLEYLGRVPVSVVAADEEVVIARATRALLRNGT